MNALSERFKITWKFYVAKKYYWYDIGIMLAIGGLIYLACR